MESDRIRTAPAWLDLLKLTAVVGLIGIVLVATVHPGNLVLVRWGIFDCQQQGGEPAIPVNRDVDVPVVVRVSSGELTFQAGKVFDRSANLLGIGTWAIGDDLPIESRGAVDALARKYSTMDSPIRESDHGSAVQAARTCAEKDLPRSGKP